MAMRAAVPRLPLRGRSVQKTGARKFRVATASTTRFTSRVPIAHCVRSSTSVRRRSGQNSPAMSGSAQSGPSRTYWKKRCKRR